MAKKPTKQPAQAPAPSPALQAAPAKATGTLPAGIIPKGQAARLLMLSEERLRQLIKAGWIKEHDRMTVSLVAAVQGYINSLKDEGSRATKSAADSRVRDARAKEIEVRTARMSGDLISTDAAMGVLDELVGIYRSEYGSLAAALTANPKERQRIQAKVDAVQRRVAERLAERGRAIRAGGQSVPAIPPPAS